MPPYKQTKRQQQQQQQQQQQGGSGTGHTEPTDMEGGETSQGCSNVKGCQEDSVPPDLREGGIG